MASVNYKKIVEEYKKYPGEKGPVVRALNEEIRAKVYTADDFSFKALFEACFGWGEIQACTADKNRLVTKDVFEHAGAVSTAAFKDISGQIVFSMMIPRYQSEEFVFTKLIPERQSPYTNEKVAGLSGIGPGTDSEWVVPEGEPYNLAGFGPNWVNLPETIKRGKIVPVTREAIFFDRTGMIREFAGDVGYWLGFNREVRATDCVIDENAGAKSAAAGGHRYHWMGTSIATYGDNSGTHSWDNLAAVNALVDWTNINVLDQVLNEIVDPFTGAPVMLDATTLIVPKSLEKTAGRILSSTQLQVVTPGYATSGNPNITTLTNPYGGAFRVVSSRLLAQRLAVKTSYFYGTPEKAFVYVVNFPFQQKMAPDNSQEEFSRDIVLQARADERGAYGTIDPRLMAKSTVA
jgi:hypothetical protein